MNLSPFPYSLSNSSPFPRSLSIFSQSGYQAATSCATLQLASDVKAVDTFIQYTLLQFQIGIDQNVLIGASENEVKKLVGQHNYEIHELRRSFGNFRAILNFQWKSKVVNE